MCGIHWVISRAMIISLLAKVSGDTSIETAAAASGANVKLIIDTLNPVNLPFDAVRLEHNDLPCTCISLTCSCCFGLNIVPLNFDNTACTTVAIVPEEFALDFAVTIRNLPIMKKRLSAKNPPSMCAPLHFFPILSFCLRAFDLGLIDNKLNACIELETKLAEVTIAVVHFKCVALGGDDVIAWKEPKVSTRAINRDDSSIGMGSVEVYEVDRSEEDDDDPY